MGFDPVGFETTPTARSSGFGMFWDQTAWKMKGPCKVVLLGCGFHECRVKRVWNGSTQKDT